MCPAAAPAAFRPCASVAPAARAAAFLAAPASSTPIGSLDCSHTTPARVNTWASVPASPRSLDAATSAAPAWTISCACAGPPMQATRWEPRVAARSANGRARSRLGRVHLMREPSDRQANGARWRNWTRDQTCRAAAVRTPASIEELSAAIGEASAAGLPVRVAGAGHSFGDIALTDGMSISLRGLSELLDVDRGSGLVRVHAGMTIRELGRRLDAHGLALENLGDIDAQTIAGAIATATHGTGAGLPNISAQVSE